MKTRLYVAIFLITVFPILTSCNSFNRVTINETSTNSPAQHYETVAVPTPGLCPAYKLPTLLKTPELPLKELERINPDDSEALDAIQRKHIADLRLYIAKLKTQIIQSHAQYLVRCKAYQAGRVQ